MTEKSIKSILFQRFLFCAYFFLISFQVLLAQNENTKEPYFKENNNIKLGYLDIPEHFHRGRFWLLTGTSAAAYAGTVAALSNVWYDDYQKAPFHTFNDFGEWEEMDKVGHLYTAYFYSHLATNAYYWTGIGRERAAWVGFGTGLFLQGTIELMDAYSAEWGFSWGDVAFNTLGSGIYLAQELAWQEQRIYIKYSSFRREVTPNYFITSELGTETSLWQRRDELFGHSVGEIMVKDYNATTIWASANIHALFIKNPESRFPKWLNIAVGYGADNIYGARSNSWTVKETGETFDIPQSLAPRQRQYYLALDIDLTKIPVKSRFLKVLFGALNTFKIPAPALEYNSTGRFRLHGLFF